MPIATALAQELAAKAKHLLGGARMVVVLATILKAMVGALGTRA
jgi:hypothetical protein